MTQRKLSQHQIQAPPTSESNINAIYIAQLHEKIEQLEKYIKELEHETN